MVSLRAALVMLCASGSAALGASGDLPGNELATGITISLGLENKGGPVTGAVYLVASAAQRFADHGEIKADLSYRIYNHGLGTRINENALQSDVAAAVSGSIGDDLDRGTPSYSVNHHTWSAIQSAFEHALNWGQAWYYNSAIKGITRTGFLNLRSGRFYFHYSNDVGAPPSFGGRTDQGWTGAVYSA